MLAFLVCLLLRSASALETRARVVQSVTSSRRRFAEVAFGALALGVAAPGAFAESVPSRDELLKLTAGYKRLDELVNNWDKITSGACQGQAAAEGRQVVATNSGGCDKSPLKVQEYVGYKSTTDPLFRAEKLMLRAAPLVDSDDAEAYLEAVTLWGQQAQMSSLMAYTSSWGEANPNGSKKQIAAYLEDARFDVEESTAILKKILKYLDLPLA